ncbi:MAG: xanthine dehydrogenase small subunit [Curvibacter sp. RIFCSPHIGHO2_12_FULL_63_18]|uniref:xanthine dehydrogenase small subunit n=1 Tax=Rhodoferax sp. TaxID=50421 RepID=UPI0008B671BC|nr:xanthine dehydrogenase small subunit [Rhodoferax sp.]OGO99941.1 MAG: xanthine dehydrogenase small subunit [Curvibacter sp. RIFCSPHIGHO2_12_FULL_63_18]HCX81906.1 xanthine dehydrogenase small subunit [Rhodoferax sp.]
MTTQVLRFIRRGEIVTLPNVPPTRTLLEVLREDLHCTGTKEGCNEGDCGACTVVVGEAVDGQLQTKAVNSCIKMAHSLDGKALWTVEDIAADDGCLHPAQEAMVQCHGSQCGFCTPGFVMSLFGLYQQHAHAGQPITRADAQHALSGNLCRCTGYRPILDAAQTMLGLPAVPVDEAKTLSKLELLAHIPRGLEADLAYKSPTTLRGLLAARAQHPQAQIVAGCTDVGLWVNKMHMDFAQVLDVTQVAELKRVEQYPHHIAIGAAVTLTDAFAALVADRPQLGAFASRFAGLPVRNAGTLGGNVANGSPIGDSMPLLIALGANVVLMALRKGKVVHRELRLEDLYTGYRKNVMAADEVLAWIKVPKAVANERSRVYKISKRFEDDISAVCLALNLHIVNGKVAHASIGVGGVAATPVRAVKTQAALLGQPWTADTVMNAMATLRAEFSPISDMRASSAYRTEVLGNLLQRYWLESQGLAAINLESFVLEGEAA